MKYSPSRNEEKVYNACIDCKHLGKKCDGPNFLTMSPEEFGEWVRMRKEYKGWTTEYLAERSGVSETSLWRIVNGKSATIKWDTAQAIAQALVDGSWGQYPCAMGADDLQTSVTLERELEAEKRKVEYLKQQIAIKDQQIADQSGFGNDRRETVERLRKSRRIARISSNVLAGLLVVAIIYISVTLIIDYRNPYRGLWWNEPTTSQG